MVCLRGLPVLGRGTRTDLQKRTGCNRLSVIPFWYRDLKLPNLSNKPSLKHYQKSVSLTKVFGPVLALRGSCVYNKLFCWPLVFDLFNQD